MVIALATLGAGATYAQRGGGGGHGGGHGAGGAGGAGGGFGTERPGGYERQRPDGAGSEMQRPQRDNNRLGLSEEQRSQVATLEQQQRTEMQAVRDNTSLSKEERKAQMDQIRSKYAAQREALLTPEQKAKSEELKAQAKDRAKERRKDRHQDSTTGTGTSTGTSTGT